jgi:hypothetical protein
VSQPPAHLVITADQLRQSLFTDLTDSTWFDSARAAIAQRPSTIGRLFPAVGRNCGRAPLSGVEDWTVDEAVRVLLLTALPLRGASLGGAIEALYRFGDAAEKRAILRGLPMLDRQRIGDSAVPVLLDAIRTNDPRLVTAALGPYAARMADADWRQAVLKCVFMGIPLAAIADLDERADATLLAMLSDFADERRAAGRPVPDDVLALFDSQAKGAT